MVTNAWGGIAAAQRLTSTSCGLSFQRTRITSRSVECRHVRFPRACTASRPLLRLRFVARASEEDESNGVSGSEDANKDDNRSSEDDDEFENAASESTKRFGFFRRIWPRGEPEPDDGADEQAENEENVSGEDELDTASSGGLTGLWTWITRKNGELDSDSEFSELEDLDIKWADLLEPTLDNALALALTGLLGLAVLQITWQLLLVAVAIIISGLKYTVLATFLIAFIIFFL